MIVKVFPTDVWGVGHYRMAWPTFAVAEQGLMNASIIEPAKRKIGLDLDRHGQPLMEHFPVDSGDVIVFHRPTPSFLPGAMRLLQARGVAVVVDMDDDLANVHPRNLSWLATHPKTSSFHSWVTADEACELADMVTVTTPRLAHRYGSHGRVAILPNCVPENYLDIKHEDSARVGWAGSMMVHPDDLQSTGAAIARLVQWGAEFCVVGPVTDEEEPGPGRGPLARALGLPQDPPSTGPVEFARYPETIAQIGIGIAPLKMTAFNEAKSWLKPMEYSAVGVPWVGSPTQAYRAYHAEGCGLIASKPRDWERTLRALVRDEGRRLDLSAAGREVAARWTYEGNAWRWAEVWEQAAANRRAARRSAQV
jgi:glycosyltransferase involved in cell wall biosynthesis